MEMEDDPLGAVPQEIKLNIFSRLPAELVLDCKLACKAWRDFIQFHVNTTYFSDLHLRHQYGHGLIQKQQHKPFEHYHYGTDSETMRYIGFDRCARVLWFLEYYDDDGISTDTPPNYCIRRFSLKLPADVSGIVGSDNGLVCLTARTKYKGIHGLSLPTFSPDEPLFVCNPMTREFVYLPEIVIDEQNSCIDAGVHIVYGFGFHPVTNKYKVVRIWYAGNPKNPSFRGQVEVYTLGSGSEWRSVGETKYYLCPKTENEGHPVGVCVNGALHWLCNDFEDIIAFDLADEKFHLLRTPRWEIYGRRLSVVRRCLCIEYQNGLSLEWWFLKKDKEEDNNNSSSYHLNDQSYQYYKSWSWNRELRIKQKKAAYIQRSFLSLTKRGEMLFTNGREVVRCTSNQIAETLEKIKWLNNWMPNEEKLPHINSFVSLHAIGESYVRKVERSSEIVQVYPAKSSETKRIKICIPFKVRQI